MLQQHTREFIRYIRHERRYSEHTARAYETDLHDYSEYISQTYGSIGLNDHTHNLIRSWLSVLLDKGLKAKTVSRKITSLKSFFKYCIQNGFIENNPTAKLQAVKIPQRLPDFVQEEDMKKLFRDLKFTEDYTGKRNYAILNILYGTGIRVSELVNLQVQNLNLHYRSLKVLGKRNKERIIPVNKELNETLENYLLYRKSFITDNKATPDKDWLFLSNQGNKTYPKLIYNIVKSHLEQVTTIGKKSPHVLRHTFATHLLSHGADLNAIKELLGHSNLAATQVYTHSSIDQLKSIYEQAHPRGK